MQLLLGTLLLGTLLLGTLLLGTLLLGNHVVMIRKTDSFRLGLWLSLQGLLVAAGGHCLGGIPRA
jgi:hypothetical protein